MNILDPYNLGLGRRAAEDPRDRRFMLEARQPAVAAPATRVSKRWPMFRKVLQQGPEGTCVGHAWRHWLEAAPVIQITRNEEPLARTLYEEACRIDEFPANDAPAIDYMYGTSVRAGWKALRARGLVGEGNSTTDMETVANFLGGKDAAGKFIGGGLVIGVSWYPSMYTPDAEGILRLPPHLGRVQEGHALCVLSWNERRGIVGGPNSWGDAWNPKKHGWWYMAAEDLQRLFDVDGEAWTAQERRV